MSGATHTQCLTLYARARPAESSRTMAQFEANLLAKIKASGRGSNALEAGTTMDIPSLGETACSTKREARSSINKSMYLIVSYVYQPIVFFNLHYKLKRSELIDSAGSTMGSE